MTMDITEVFRRTDWPALARQKQTFIRSINLVADIEQRNDLAWLLRWIDAVQDAAANAGFPVEFTEQKGKLQ